MMAAPPQVSYHFEETLRGMIAAHGMPAEVTFETLLGTWSTLLADLSDHEFRHTAIWWAGRESRWPHPHEIREFALHQRTVDQRQAVRFGPNARCPQCKRLPFFAGFELPKGKVISRVRCGCPQASERW